MAVALKAPFPYFGGKSRVADDVWARFGDPKNYVEPFAGSLAVLLGRPAIDGVRIETVNDLDGFVSNFWRAVRVAPEAVARWVDYPVIETDLFARHLWLVERKTTLQRELEADPDYFDAKVAGWWVWGLSAWIGSGWCDGKGPWVRTERGIEKRDAGRGVHRRLPHLGDAGKGVHRRLPLYEWIGALSERLRNVRVCCGDWARVLTPSVTTKHGLTAVFLDPPYGEGDVDYGNGGNGCASVASAVRKWAIDHGDDPQFRIALCGYDEQYDMPESWSVHAWRAKGGYGKSDQSRANSGRERIWFSPHCMTCDELTLL